MVLWNGTDILPLVLGDSPPSWSVSGISIDSRTTRPGDLFIALRGPTHDGHNFVETALSRGAVAALVEKTHPSAHLKDKTIVVRDTMDALVTLARAARSRFLGKVLAVTGTVGKTSVKTGIMHVLSRQQATSGTEGSLNNHIGLPLSLARLPAHHAYGVFELGMNHSGEIRELVSILRPHVSLITTVTPAHMAAFHYFEDLVRAKLEVCSDATTHTVILNRDIPCFPLLEKETQHVARRITFGTHYQSTIRLIETALLEEDKISAKILIDQKPIYCILPAIGDYWIRNSLAILASVFAIGGSVERAANDLEDFLPLPGRGQRLNVHGIDILDESYNANPASMKEALLRFLHVQSAGKKIAIIGEMREMGDHTAYYHKELATFIQADILPHIDGILTCGPALSACDFPQDKWWQHDDTVDGLFSTILSRVSPGDLLLLKGSHSIALEKIITLLEHTFLEKKLSL